MPARQNKQVGRFLRGARLAIAVMLLIWGCARAEQSLPNDLAQSSLAATDCTSYEAAFEVHLDPEVANCTADFLEVAATGLPDLTSGSGKDAPMVGIKSWIQRVAVPYDYHWQIPLSPSWLDEPVEASARGPIAVAVDGVPIFHQRVDLSISQPKLRLTWWVAITAFLILSCNRTSSFFEKNEAGEYRLAFDSPTIPEVTSAILYRQTSADCWAFEYQPVAGETGQITEACRH